MKDYQEDFPLHEFYGDIYSTYDRVNRVFTFGLDRVWRRKAAGEVIQNKPARVLDLCTGTGDFIFEVADQAADLSLESELTGFDFSIEMLKEAERKYTVWKGRGHFPEIHFREGDAAGMPFQDGYFDSMGITFGIRNLVYANSKADRHLSEINRVLRKGGQLVVLESCRPESSLWRLFNDMYLRFILPYLGGIISGNLKAYQYLARSSRNYYTISEMGSILGRAGFKMIRSKSLFLGSVMLLVLEKR
jgi:demethylmenaquinone methyltransferase / 2-methoxy-6-polyprenyl-1,4-benzoquinol methylase